MSKKTLVDTTAQKLMVYIDQNSLQPGDKLPNEFDLSKILNVGRNTTREAVRVLASRNILAIRQGAGTFVADNTGVIEDPLGFSFVANPDKLVDDLMQIRIMVEPQIAALAAENATKEDIEDLEQICLDIEKAIQHKEDFSELDKAFHSHVGRICGNDVISKLLPIIAEGISVYSNTVSEQETVQTIKSHQAILNAIKNKRPTEAEQAMLFHLLFNRNRM